MTAFYWTFLALTASSWFISWALFAKFKTVPKVPQSTRPQDSLPKISVIIPARDEESNLDRLLPSIFQQSFPVHEVLVINDQSSDGTASMAEKHGATVINGLPLPEGWKGKSWACTQGSKSATGDWFLFLDADTWLEPDGLERIAHLANSPNVVHSICPFHKIEEPFEEFSAFPNATMALGTNAFSLKGDKANGIALFGQSLFVSKANYLAVGGHESVKHHILENLQLSSSFREAGVEPRCYLGRGTIGMRMFQTNLSDLKASWAKGIVSGADSTPKGALIGISIWISGQIMSTIALAFIPLAPMQVLWGIAALYLAFALQTLFLFRKIGSFSIFNALFYPIGQAFYQFLFFQSLSRKKRGETIHWKGRDVSD